MSTGVGDEGGFAPDAQSNIEAVALVVEAIRKAGYKPGADISVASGSSKLPAAPSARVPLFDAPE